MDTPQNIMPPVRTVSEVVALMKGCLEREFASVDIEAEISNVRTYPSRHIYFALKDSGAQLSAVLFARVPCDCRAMLADGRRVKVRGRVSIYPQRGECQFIVTRIKIAGEGELMAKYLALKARLEAEGLFAKSRKRPLPAVPRRIGIVTSPAGAVVHDMFRVLSRRFANLELRIFPAQVQGADAPPSLVAGIGYFSRSTDWRADVVIIARGGGSFEDLFCFNDETLVRAIAASSIPVISAVGHETDFTLCDFAADIRAGTPSIAAEIAVPLLSDMRERISRADASLAESLRRSLDASAQHLDRLASSLAPALRSALQLASHRIDRCSAAMASSLKAAAASSSLKLSSLAKRLDAAAAVSIERAAARLDKTSSRLALLSPYSVLERGYSLTTDSSGAVVRDAASLEIGSRIVTRLAKGSFTATVEETRRA